jgi:hypothetical protein
MTRRSDCMNAQQTGTRRLATRGDFNERAAFVAPVLLVRPRQGEHNPEADPAQGQTALWTGRVRRPRLLSPLHFEDSGSGRAKELMASKKETRWKIATYSI